jgi:hypothetical protein
VCRRVLQAGIMLSLAFVHVIADGFKKMEVRLQPVRIPQVSGVRGRIVCACARTTRML